MKTDLIIFVISTIVLLKCFEARGQNLPIDDSDEHPDARIVKCLVCKATLEEMIEAVSKVDPRKRVDIGYQLGASGDAIRKTVQMSKSETYLSDLMESICDKMDDYAKARFKSNRTLTVLKLTSAGGGMNPAMSAVDFIQDGDLNKSLKHFCLGILEDNEDAILKEFQQDAISDNIDIEVCTKSGGYCDDVIPEDDYVLEEHEEL